MIVFVLQALDRSPHYIMMMLTRRMCADALMYAYRLEIIYDSPGHSDVVIWNWSFISSAGRRSDAQTIGKHIYTVRSVEILKSAALEHAHAAVCLQRKSSCLVSVCGECVILCLMNTVYHPLADTNLFGITRRTLHYLRLRHLRRIYIDAFTPFHK